MNETPFLDKPAEGKEEAAFYQAQVDDYLAQIKHLQQQMTDERGEILQLQAETRAILADVMATLRA